jgi:hypothetical protein
VSAARIDKPVAAPARRQHEVPGIMTLEEFFAGKKPAKRLFDAIAGEVARLGNASVQVSKSQVAFCRTKNFAIVWTPETCLLPLTPPLVLTLSFACEDRSPKWKQITKVSESQYTHHLELHRVRDVDQQVHDWLRRAWEAA